MKINQSSLTLLLFFLTTILLSSCNEELENPCDTPRDGEIFTISPAAIAFVSNYENADRVIFKTEIGEEVSYDISPLDGCFGEYYIGGICDEDPSMGQTVRGTIQTLYMSLTNTIEAPEPIVITMTRLPFANNQNLEGELFSVSLGQVFPLDLEGERLFENIIDTPHEIILFHDSLDILGKRFYSVFENINRDPVPSIEIKYTKAEGVIHYKNSNTGREYIYDRVE